jgi:hypothetical protein
VSPLATRAALTSLLALAVACGGESTDSGSTDASARAKSDHVAVVGDSISEQSAEQIEQVLGAENDVRIEARIGRTFESSQDEADAVAAESPEIVIIELGTNDVWTEQPLDAVSGEIEEMLDKFSDACVIMVTVNEHTRNARSLDGTLFDNAHAHELNEEIRESTTRIVDWNAEANTDPGRYLDAGTVHPTPAGRSLLATLMDQAVETCPSDI